MTHTLKSVLLFRCHAVRSVQRQTGLKQASACLLCEGPGEKAKGSLFALQSRKGDLAAPFSFLCLCLGMLQSYPVVTVLHEPSPATSSQATIVAITSVIFFPASKLASCSSAICKWRSAARPPHAAAFAGRQPNSPSLCPINAAPLFP